jgi:hypothetical protein
MTDEYQQEQQTGKLAELARYMALAGSASAYAALLAGTEALMRDEGWDPVEYLTEAERDAFN